MGGRREFWFARRRALRKGHPMRRFIAPAAVMCSVYLGSASVVLGGIGQNLAVETADRLTLLIYDSIGVLPSEMIAAHATVCAILLSASIQTEWHACADSDGLSIGGDSVCSEPLPGSKLLVRIVAATPAVPWQSLGSALVDPRHGGGVLTTVYADRVHSLAERSLADPGLLLGRTIAHEIGHLLKRTPAHESAGLMRAHWSALEVRRNLPVDWRWSNRDLAEIARGMATRAAARGVHERSDSRF
jgi:hypothetical protein